MNPVFHAVQHFDNGCTCSQAIISAYGRSYGLDTLIGLKLAAGFAMGMQTGKTCGAVAGACMVLGLALCTDDCAVKEGRKKAYIGVATFADRFVQRNKSLICNELLGCDITTLEGLKTAREGNLFKTVCSKMVQDAAEILEEILFQDAGKNL